jgi:hypothetical protein
LTLLRTHGFFTAPVVPATAEVAQALRALLRDDVPAAIEPIVAGVVRTQLGRGNVRVGLARVGALAGAVNVVVPLARGRAVLGGRCPQQEAAVQVSVSLLMSLGNRAGVCFRFTMVVPLSLSDSQFVKFVKFVTSPRRITVQALPASWVRSCGHFSSIQTNLTN